MKIHVPAALVLGCNTPHGIGVLSDYIEEQTGHPIVIDGFNWVYIAAYGNGCGYFGFNDGDGCGWGYGYFGCGDGYSVGNGNGDGIGYSKDYSSPTGGGIGDGWIGDGQGNGGC